ncbi:hypothetical protein C8J56DRAFT_934694 [Mycena floridula]|nr:hypothetical protein C8J56DRAFT_934694 [Mycena floridula]
MSPSPVIIYRYDTSPYAAKLDNVLLLKGIPHQQVKISNIMPRPEIVDLLGLNYRRIPILAIGRDVYCDTNLITSVLERRFCGGSYRTIFPPRNNGSKDTGLIKAFSKEFVDIVFPLCSAFIPWDRIPSSFIKDRETFTGGKIDADAIMASRGPALITIKSHMALIEEQLENSGGDWLFDTEMPNLADVSVGFLLSWLKQMPNASPILDSTRFPRTLQWHDRLEKYISSLKKDFGPVPIITGDEAAASMVAASFEPLNIVGFDETDASHLSLSLGDRISIAPSDTGRAFATTGQLVALNAEEFVIETQGSSGVFRCHFPRIGFTVKSVASKL